MTRRAPSLARASTRPAPTGWGRLPASLACLAVLAFGLSILAACAVIDPLNRETCISLVPALEGPDARVTVLAVAETPERRDNLRVRYRVEVPGSPGRVTDLVCAFGDETGSGDRRALLGVRTADGDLGPSRLYFLKRFWLGDPAALADSATRIVVDPAADPHGLTTLPADAALWLQRGVDALAPCALYALLGLACSLIWGLVGRVNFAFGDIATLGAYGALIGALAVEAAGFGEGGAMVAGGLVVAVAVTAAWGAVLGRVVFEPLAFRTTRPLLVATVGLSIVLQEFIARSQGARDRFLPPILNRPLMVADGPFPVMVTPMRLLIAALATVAVVAVLGVWPRTRFGRAWRAVADDRAMARLLGIDPARVLVVTFALSAALAALAGAVLTLAFGGTSFAMGTLLGLKAVVAAVVGGIGSLPGGALGGLLLGLGETLWSAVFGEEWRDVAVLAALAAVLMFRPAGLLGTAAALEEPDLDR
ncbi:branched-chain amino acid ABC transporter permease [Siculibacillus lacustris]|uniref:branched-chain amino acid ABC transporter permease n=1 Tax=Siculibacillus lacustris TaxID=1549641 RepID=UPI0013F16D47|nr:branched-chain amino acid ABC transporter permease [Siculibacillus lacustris]